VFYTFTYEEVVKALGKDQPHRPRGMRRPRGGNYKEEASVDIWAGTSCNLATTSRRWPYSWTCRIGSLDILTSGFRALYRCARAERVQPWTTRSSWTGTV